MGNRDEASFATPSTICSVAIRGSPILTKSVEMLYTFLGDGFTYLPIRRILRLVCEGIDSLWSKYRLQGFQIRGVQVDL